MTQLFNKKVYKVLNVSTLTFILVLISLNIDAKNYNLGHNKKFVKEGTVILPKADLTLGTLEVQKISKAKYNKFYKNELSMHLTSEEKAKNLGGKIYDLYMRIIYSISTNPVFIFSSIPTTKPTTKPGTKPKTPYQPGPGTNPKPKATFAEGEK